MFNIFADIDLSKYNNIVFGCFVQQKKIFLLKYFWYILFFLQGIFLNEKEFVHYSFDFIYGQ